MARSKCLLGVLLLVGLLFGACNWAGSAPPRKILEQAVKTLDQEAFTFNSIQYVTVRSKTLSVKLFIALSQNQGKVQPPGAYRWSGSYSDSTGSFGKAEYAVINEKNYTLDPQTGGWSEISTPASTMLPPLVIGQPETVRGLKLAGEETLGSMPVYHLTGADSMRYNLPGEGEMKVALQVDHWIDKQTGRLVKTAAEGTLPVVFNDRPADLRILWTFTYTDYGKTPAIELPK